MDMRVNRKYRKGQDKEESKQQEKISKTRKKDNKE
jgi:hypothetical protein